MLLAVPALRALKAGGEPLTLAAQPRIGRLLLELGVVDEAVDFDALRLDALFAGGEGEPGADAGDPPEERPAPLARFTRVVSWFGSRDPGFVARLAALVPGALVAAPHRTGRPVWAHLLETSDASPADARRLREPIAVPAAVVEAGRRALERAGWSGAGPVVVVHPGAGGVAKRWPAEGFAAVLERVAARHGATLVLHQGPADREAVARLETELRCPSLSLTEPTLTTLAGVLAAASAYLGNDSGVSHLAAALGAPATVLFTRDKLDWRSWALDAEPLVVETAALDPRDVERVAAALDARIG